MSAANTLVLTLARAELARGNWLDGLIKSLLTSPTKFKLLQLKPYIQFQLMYHRQPVLTLTRAELARGNWLDGLIM
ncbi:MAG: hypothetical protein JXM68_00320 [Sedimentisphaerales bacterium]|nr:hypothetical protein [Sedimentisphaerales bacterium]